MDKIVNEPGKFIRLVFSNENAFALSGVYIHGKLANPNNFEINAREDKITLTYSLHRCEVEIDGS